MANYSVLESNWFSPCVYYVLNKSIFQGIVLSLGTLEDVIRSPV